MKPKKAKSAARAAPSARRSAPAKSGDAAKTSKEALPEIGMTRAQALKRRARLQAFAEDWDAPGMEVYDDPRPAPGRSRPG